MPRAFSETERRLIKNRLLSAGKHQLNLVGPRRLSVDEVTREAGIAKGSFYAFFPSKEDFVLSVFEDWEAEHRGALLDRITGSAGSARDKLEAFFSGAADLLGKEPGLARLGFSDLEDLLAVLPPERVAAHQARDEAALTTAFTSWAATGDLDAEALEALPDLFSALFILALHKSDFTPGGYETATRLLSEALALRLTSPRHGGLT